MGRKRKRSADGKFAPVTNKISRAASSKKTTSTIETKTNGLEAYSQTIIEAALEERKRRQLQYRDSVQQTRKQLQEARENENGALNIFPEEIWIAILKNIEETDTLIKCSKADGLFRQLIKQEEILFGKALPFLSVYLAKPDILSCRQVCSKWRSGVESLLESYHEIPLSTTKIPAVAPPPSIRRTRKFDFETILEFTEELEPQLHANLLPGGSATITNFFTSDPAKLQKFDEWMNINGNGVRHATLNMKNKGVNISQLDRLCHRLANCSPNLKTLTLSGGYMDGRGRRSVPKGAFRFPNLESLTVTTKCPDLQQVQFDLLKSLSKQLKRVSVFNFIPTDFDKLSWNNLQELEIIEENSSLAFNVLAKLRAPLLQTLKIRLDSTCQELTQLFQTLNHFPNLASLRLTLCKQCPIWSEKEIMKIPVKLLVCNKITDLEVVSPKLETRRDFLVCFPFVRNLIVRVGKNSAKGSAFHYKSGQIDSDDYEEFSQDESSEDEATRQRNRRQNVVPGSSEPAVGKRQSQPKPMPRSPPAPEFLDLNKFCQTENLKNFYKSNIWKVMPQLENLQLQNVFCQPMGYRGRRPPKRFTKYMNLTRRAYVWENEPWEKRQELHLEKVWQNAKQQMREKVRNLASGNEGTGKIGGKFTKKQKQEQQNLLQDKALPFVLQKLTRSSILSCRRVSKSWKDLVDKYFLCEELRSRDMVYRITFADNDDDEMCSKSSSESSSDSNSSVNNFQVVNVNPTSAQIQENLNKPFFGRIVEVTLKADSFSVVDDLRYLLSTLGKKIEHLRISSNNEMDMEDLKEIRIRILEHCPNLRTIYLHFSDFWRSSPDSWSDEERTQKTLMHHPNLESVTLSGPGPDKSRPDKVARVLKMKSSYQNLLSGFVSFPNLKHLKMAAGLSDQWMTCIEKYLEAPQLENLELRFSGRWNTIEELVKVVNKFPKVKSLDLEFYAGFGGLSNFGVIYTQPSCLSTNVTYVKITVERKEEVSLDFLVHFPFLRKLCITYGDEAAPWNKEASEDSDDEDESDSEDEQNKDTSFLEPERDYVKLAQYFGNKKPIRHNTAKILNSNIWTALKRLEKLEVVVCLAETKQQSTVFTRKQREAKIERKV